MSETIVKIQRPIAGDYVGTDICLVYDENKKIVIEQSVGDVVIKSMGDKYRAYFYANLSTNGRWVIGDSAPAQPW
jgi:hypothetical protein